jgi:hypothetical protein
LIAGIVRVTCRTNAEFGRNIVTAKHHVARLLLFASAVTLSLSANSAWAISGTTAAPAKADDDVACLQLPAKLDKAQIEAFLADPGLILKENPAGGLKLSNRVRELAGSSHRALARIRELSKQANEAQKVAIAAGLARVVFVCGTVGGDLALNYSAEIQTMVAQLGDSAFANAFLRASSDISVAALGYASSSSTGSAGAVDGGSTGVSAINYYRSPGDAPRLTTSSSYTIGKVDPYIDDVKTTSPSGSN